MNEKRIVKMIKDIERFFNHLDKEGLEKKEDLEDLSKFYSVSMIMFSIVNRAIDLGEEVVAEKNLGFPERYRDIFNFLKEGDVITKEMAKKLSDLVYFRNAAAHEYQGFTDDDVFRAYKQIDIVKDFVSSIKELLKE